MSIVELDGGDAKKMLDDLQDAKAMASQIANEGGVSLEHVHELSKRLGKSKDLLAKAMLLEKMRDGEPVSEGEAPACPSCGEDMLDDSGGMYGGWFCANGHRAIIISQ